jgi:alkanesulfonate monooxygenase SsuD/methylene tetrahydromethanopterin reductase-like flavin-dependent oxidoreductase (luciferase family)
MAQIQFCLIVEATPAKALRATYIAEVSRALALISASGHFDSFRMIDHLDDGKTDMLESFTTLAYLAALHPRLKFGHSVVCQTFRNPALVAKMGATLQYLSGGRFLLGIGAGGNEEEHRSYGYDFPPGRVRVEQLEEALQIIKAMWSGEEAAAFKGRYYRVNEASCEPRPDPLPPVMVGAYGPKMLRVTAKYADEWNVASIGIARYRRMAAEFERACAEVGRDPATVRRSWGGGCICMPTQAEALRLGGTRYNSHPEDDFDFVGPPSLLIEQMRPFIEMGVTSFLVDCGGFPRLTTLELLINEVIPALQG